MKDNIKKQLIQLVVVISSGICAYFFPIASKFLNIQSDKYITGSHSRLFYEKEDECNSLCEIG